MPTCVNPWCRNPVTRAAAHCAACRKERQTALQRIRRGNDDPAGPLRAEGARMIFRNVHEAVAALDDLNNSIRSENAIDRSVALAQLDRATAALRRIQTNSRRWRTLDALRDDGAK